VIDFADTGPGIAPEERDKVFDAFYSGSTPQGGPLKGTGIGLSVVREFVEAHGGTVEIVTGQYPGAHLRIRLPGVARREAAHAA
jgi:two-component system, NtrC family, sensor histidine kinase GlrK